MATGVACGRTASHAGPAAAEAVVMRGTAAACSLGSASSAVTSKVVRPPVNTLVFAAVMRSFAAARTAGSAIANLTTSAAAVVFCATAYRDIFVDL